MGFKLSILTQFYPPDYAATGQLIDELANKLASLGLQVKVFTGQPGYAFRKASAPAKERVNNVIIKRSRSAQLWPSRIRGKALNGVLFCLRSGLHLIKTSSRGDVLLVTTAPPFLPILGYLAKLCFNLPYVCLMYDLYPDVAVELKVVSKNHWLAKFWDWCNQLAWQEAQSIIVLSSTMKDRVEAKCPQISNKISVIHNWANPDWIVPISKQENWFAKKHNLLDTFTVLYSGNMGRCHEMDTILAAAKQLENEPIQFVFIGGGAKLANCLEIVNKLGLLNCRFLPYQDKQVLPYSLTACDLSLVSVTPGMEGLVAPSKLYGSLAAGRPVVAICESHSYLRSLIIDAQCGVAIDNGDATGLAKFICCLAKDSQLAKQMGNAGRQYLQTHFTPEIIAKQYYQLLRQAVLTAKQQDDSSNFEVFPLTSLTNNRPETVKEDIER